MVDKNNNNTIITALRENSRASLTKISKQHQIPVSTIYEKLQRLEKTIIKRHTCLLDFEKMGYSVRVILNITVRKDMQKEFEKYMLSEPAVNNLYRVAGNSNYQLHVVFKDIKELELFKEAIEAEFKIKKFEQYYVLGDICKEKMFMNPLIYKDDYLKTEDIRI